MNTSEPNRETTISEDEQKFLALWNESLQAKYVHLDPSVLTMARKAVNLGNFPLAVTKGTVSWTIQSWRQVEEILAYATHMSARKYYENNPCVYSKYFLDELSKWSEDNISVERRLFSKDALTSIDKDRRRQLSKAFISAYDTVNSSTPGGIGQWQSLLVCTSTDKNMDAHKAIRGVLVRDLGFCQRCSDRLFEEIAYLNHFLTTT